MISVLLYILKVNCRQEHLISEQPTSIMRHIGKNLHTFNETSVITKHTTVIGMFCNNTSLIESMKVFAYVPHY